MVHALYLAFRVLHSSFAPARVQLSLYSSVAPLKGQMTLRSRSGVCFSLFNTLNLPIIFPRPSTSSRRPSHLLRLILIHYAIRREPI